MLQPTGFKFVYNGVETDFRDVFDISIPGTQTTGYISEANNQDLGYIFTLGNSGITTYYKYSSNIDLGSIFALPNISPPDNPTIITTTCYKQITLNWTDSDPTITSYNIYKDLESAINVPSSTFTYTFTSLINGTLYSLNVKAVNANGESANSSIYVSLPTTSTYFTGGSGVQSGSDYIITFTSSGSLTYSCPGVSVNCNLLLVGGGGGGAGGNYSGYSGGGGGGGYVINISNCAFSTANNNVTIGGGGNKGSVQNNGSNGSNSSFLSYIANGGNGGFSSTGLGGTGNGNGGNSAKSTLLYGVQTYGLGNSGGSSSLIPYSGGGGSGGGVSESNIGGGGAGISGIGGIGGSSSTSGQNGQSVSTYGSGGGGGCGFYYFGTGGDGYKGVVIFTIPN
jgi:hypothetical protein